MSNRDHGRAAAIEHLKELSHPERDKDDPVGLLEAMQPSVAKESMSDHLRDDERDDNNSGSATEDVDD